MNLKTIIAKDAKPETYYLDGVDVLLLYKIRHSYLIFSKGQKDGETLYVNLGPFYRLKVAPPECDSFDWVAATVPDPGDGWRIADHDSEDYQDKRCELWGGKAWTSRRRCNVGECFLIPSLYRVPIAPPKPKLAVGDWVQYKNRIGEVVEIRNAGWIIVRTPDNGCEGGCDPAQCKRVTFRPFESAEEFDPYRERWMLFGDGTRRRMNSYRDKNWEALLHNRTWHSIHGDDWDGQPCGVRVVEQ